MRITVVDYDRGNLFSVDQALRHCGAEVELVSTANGIETAERLVLPGVGAFGDAMDGLNERGLTDALKAYAQSGRPFMGICIGMQLLFDGSDESAGVDGLGILPGRVTAIPAETPNGQHHKVPHIGWAEVSPSVGRNNWQGTLLQETAAGSSFYFVHSFTATPELASDRLADVDYDGVCLSAAVQRGNVTGFQFHPEKSGERGLDILRAFISERSENQSFDRLLGPNDDMRNQR